MKCQNCGKNEATFYYKSNINGRVMESHLCPQCARQLGLVQDMRRPMMSSFWDDDDFFTRPFRMLEPLLGGFGSRLLDLRELPLEGQVQRVPWTTLILNIKAASMRFEQGLEFLLAAARDGEVDRVFLGRTDDAGDLAGREPHRLLLIKLGVLEGRETLDLRVQPGRQVHLLHEKLMGADRHDALRNHAFDSDRFRFA